MIMSDVDYLRRILNARVYDVAVETPLEHAGELSTRIGNDVLIKREDLQEVFSFKIRGAYNKMIHLSSDERARGVIASSAGNHAQGVALAANALGCDAVIVMPTSAPSMKVDAVRTRGAEFGPGVDRGAQEPSPSCQGTSEGSRSSSSPVSPWCSIRIRLSSPIVSGRSWHECP